MDERETAAMEKRRAMKAVGMKMSLCMGITLSFFLSLSGTLFSGHFTIPSFLLSFGISTIISTLIGLLIPMKPLLDKVSSRLKKPSLAASLLETLVSDCIYTPFVTFSMVALARKAISLHAPQDQVPPLIPMFLHSLSYQMVIGYVLILIFMPFFMKRLLKGIPQGPKQSERSEQKEQQ